jgi:hypothetical protein
LIGVFTFCGLLLTSAAQAEKFTFDLDLVFGGAMEPTGPKPWLTATFEDIFANPGDVQPAAVGLTMTAGRLGGGEYVGGWYFNIDPGFSATLGFVYQGFPGNPSLAGPAASVSTQSNSQNADGPRGAGFDLLFTFPGPQADTFDDGESVSYLIGGSGARASVFNFLNQPPGGQGEFFSAAQVLGIRGEGFAWIASGKAAGPGPGPDPDPIPEPATLLLLGAGLIGLGLFGRGKLMQK